MTRFPYSMEQYGSLPDLDLLSVNPERISAALEGEVGLVQGKRRKRKLRQKRNENSFGRFEDPGGAGAGDSGGVVTKLSWRVLKTSANGTNQEEKKGDAIKIREELERLLTGFCVSQGIHFHLPGTGDGDDNGSSLFTQQSGDRRKSGKHRAGSGAGGQEHEGTGPSHHRSSRFSTAASGGRKSRAGAGGKHPPTSSESEFNHRETFTTSPELTTDVTTTDNGEDHHEEGKKKLKSHSHLKKPSTHFPSEELRLGSSPSGIHTPRITITEDKSVFGASHSIQGFTATGKKEKKATIDFSSTTAYHSSTGSHQLSTRKSVLKARSSQISRPSSTRSTFQQIFEKPPPPTRLEHVQKQMQRHSLKKRKRHPKFNHDVMSSIPSSLITSVNDVRSMRTELDSEWLEWSSSKDENIDEDGQQHESELRKKRESEKSKKGQENTVEVQPDLKYFMESTRILDTLNSILGLYPYRKVQRSNQYVQVKWEPKSRQYLGLCINAFFFVSFTLSAMSSIVFLLTADFTGTKSVTHQFVHAEFANHFPETLFLVLSSLFLSIWSVSCLFELGVHYSHFFSRFNMGICVLKYDVTDGIRRMIIIHLGAVAVIMLATTALFFGGRKFPFVRESTGFLAYCILRPFEFAMRESIYFPLVQIFGLLVLHYFFLSVNVVLLQFAVYGKALGNMASKFNLRLGYAFGGLSEVGRDGKEKRVKKVIPLEKLYAEHLVIVSLFKNLSQVNQVAFQTFTFCMTCEIVLVIWLLFDIFLDKSHTSQEQFVDEGAGGVIQLPVPLRVHELNIEAIIKSVALFLVTMITFGLFGGVMHNAADKLHTGIECIRRKGLLLCSSSKERKFILSMINSFTTKQAYWIGKTFSFNRAFILRLLGVTIAASMVCVTYRPDSVVLLGIERCDDIGICLSIRLTEKQLHLYYALYEDAIPPSPTRPSTFLPPRPTPLPIPFAPFFKEKFSPDIYIWRTPCNSFSEVTFDWDRDMAYVCPTEWSSPTHLTVPYLYKLMVYKTPFLEAFGRIRRPFTSDFSSYGSCPNKTHNQYDFPYESLFGKEPAAPPDGPPVGSCLRFNTSKERDDCGNLKFEMPHTKHQWKTLYLPQKQLIPVNMLPEFKKEDERFFCCFEYALEKMKEEVRVCNMPDPETLDIRCKEKPWTEQKFVRCANALKALRKGARDVLATTVPFDDSDRLKWTDCLCERNPNVCKILKC